MAERGESTTASPTPPWRSCATKPRSLTVEAVAARSDRKDLRGRAVDVLPVYGPGNGSTSSCLASPAAAVWRSG